MVSGNFLLQVFAQFLTKLGDAIANPKTILAWMLGALTAVIPVSGVILILAAMGLAGSVLSARLPEVA